jgi:hypothetical protein
MMADSHHERSNTWFQEVFPHVFPCGLRGELKLDASGVVPYASR